jgi:L-rhamnose mutarotase
MRRFGQLIGLDRTRLDEYKRYHARIWPEIEHAIREAGIRNYSIFHRDGQLFAYFEYHGPDDEFAARMQRLAVAPRMREWWDIMEPMQRPLSDRAPGAWWCDLEEVFHQD